MFRAILLATFLFAQVVFGDDSNETYAEISDEPNIALTESRIVGGRPARLGQFPHQVSLRTASNFHFCGGSILNIRWILTAAHCTISQTPSNVFPVVGAYLLSSGGVKHSSIVIINHPSYDGSKIVYDVAVIKTATNILFNANVKPIPLFQYRVDQLFPIPLLVSGWGATSNSGGAPDNLQWLLTYSVPRYQCEREIRLNFDTLCARAWERTGKGICFGDSGGPLIIPFLGQVGVNSFVVGGCGRGYPDGFASIAPHRSWIVSKIV